MDDITMTSLSPLDRCASALPLCGQKNTPVLIHMFDMKSNMAAAWPLSAGLTVDAWKKQRSSKVPAGTSSKREALHKVVQKSIKQKYKLVFNISNMCGKSL